MDHPDLTGLITAQPTADPDRFTLEVPDGLQQGRGAWGGIAVGAMVSAADQLDRVAGMPVRSVTAQLVGPVLVGRVTILVERLRGGSATSTVATRVLDGAGRLLAHGVVVSGAARRGPAMPDGAAWLDLTQPPELAAGPEAVPVVSMGPPSAPDFTAHLEFRPVLGAPYRAAPVAATAGWLRPCGPVSRIDASLVAALADAWWVAVLARIDRPRPVATVGYTLDLIADPEDITPAADGGIEPLFHRGRTLAAREGYTVEVRELWTRSGRLLSWNTQTVVTIQ